MLLPVENAGLAEHLSRYQALDQEDAFVTALQRIFAVHKPLIGMCHLLGLPGQPRHNTAGGVEAIADGAIVGTSLKVDGVTWNPVDVERARRMVELVHRVREHAG